MIRRLVLTNFGPFKHLDVEFDEVTRITGDNGSGKSHIFDALDIICNCKQFPEYLVFHGEKASSIRAYFDNGVSIERIRENNVQTMVIVEPTGERRYSNPLQMKDEVSRLIRFKDKSIDVNTSISCQFIPIDADQFFMVEGISSQTVMRRIANLVSGSDFSVAKKNIEEKIKEKTAIVRHLKKEVLEKEDKLQGLTEESLAVLNSKFEDLSALDEKYARLLSDVHAMEADIDNLERYKDVPDEKSFDKAKTLMSKVTEIETTYNGKASKFEDLLTLITAIEGHEARSQELADNVLSLEKELVESGNICSECGGFIASA